MDPTRDPGDAPDEEVVDEEPAEGMAPLITNTGDDEVGGGAPTG
jgi:hypothetical protein